MFWLQSLPWGRWVLASLLILFAGWLEFRPDPTTAHPFATDTIDAGEPIDATNTKMRQIQRGLLAEVPLASVATFKIERDDPVLLSDVQPASEFLPTGWWVVAIDVPGGSARGDRVRLVLHESGRVVDGFVAAEVTDDPFDQTSGSIAVPANAASEVAIAVANGQATVLISTG